MKKPFHNWFVYMARPGTFFQCSDTADSPQARTIYVWLRKKKKLQLFIVLFWLTYFRGREEKGAWGIGVHVKRFNPRRVVWCYVQVKSRALIVKRGHENQPFSQFSFMLLHLHARVERCALVCVPRCELKPPGDGPFDAPSVWNGLPGDIRTDQWRFEIFT